MFTAEAMTECCSEADLVRLFAASSPPCCSRYFAWKSWLDQVLALVLLVPGLPAIALLMVLVRLTSRGPAIYRQKRVGKGGKTFTMLKIRTMCADAESVTGAVWTQSNDPRITRLGRLLRKVHLDEFPQLFNVLRGEMSLVGPRPERPEFVAVLADEIPGYEYRLMVLPGVTGLAQINLPPDSDLDSVRRKQLLDLHYIETAGFWLDLRMMICTSLRLIGFSGDVATRLLRLERAVAPADAAASEPSSTTPEALLQTRSIRPNQTLIEQQISETTKQDQRQLGADPHGNGNGNGKVHRDHPAGNGRPKTDNDTDNTRDLRSTKPK